MKNLINSTTFLSGNSEGINKEAVKNSFIEKCILLMEKQSYKNSNPEIIGKIEHLQENGLHYFYFESSCNSYNNKAKRYHLGVYSLLLFNLYYNDSNIIDKSKSIAIDEVKSRFKNYLKMLTDTVNGK